MLHRIRPITDPTATHVVSGAPMHFIIIWTAKLKCACTYAAYFHQELKLNASSRKIYTKFVALRLHWASVRKSSYYRLMGDMFVTLICAEGMPRALAAILHPTNDSEDTSRAPRPS